MDPKENKREILRLGFFLFAFIGFNLCFTISVYHGIFTEVVTVDTIHQFPFKVLSHYLEGTCWSVTRV